MENKMNSNLVARYREFKLAGISESATRELLKELNFGENAVIDCLANPGEILVRITVQVANSCLAVKMLETFSAKVQNKLKDYIFSIDGEIIEELTGRLLRQKRLTIALAESCTGGLIAARLTNIPGCSEYFKGGVVAYSNELKEHFLGVPPEVLDTYGAVSQETATAMANGIRSSTSSDIGLAVTGIAGPGGDSPGKPLGLVYIALSSPDGVTCNRYIFPGDRSEVRLGTVNVALNTVRRFLS